MLFLHVISLFFRSGGRRAAPLGRSLCVSGASVTALTALVAISRESKNSCSQLVESFAFNERVSTHNRLALLYCCFATVISLCVSVLVESKFLKKAHTV